MCPHQDYRVPAMPLAILEWTHHPDAAGAATPAQDCQDMFTSALYPHQSGDLICFHSFLSFCPTHPPASLLTVDLHNL